MRSGGRPSPPRAEGASAANALVPTAMGDPFRGWKCRADTAVSVMAAGAAGGDRSHTWTVKARLGPVTVDGRPGQGYGPGITQLPPHLPYS